MDIHGEKDDVVKPEYSRFFIEGLNAGEQMFAILNIRGLGKIAGIMRSQKKTYSHGCFRKRKNNLINRLKTFCMEE